MGKGRKTKGQKKETMKKALKTSLLFLLAVGIISLAIMEVYFTSESYYYQDSAERDALNGTIDCIISGSSHSLRGINPAIVDEELQMNSYNLSGALLTMKGRYLLLKKELERNPVKFMILEFSYNSMSRDRLGEGPEGELYAIARYGNLPERIKYFFSCIYPSEYGAVYYDTFSRGMETILAKATHTYRVRENIGLRGYRPFDDLEQEENLHVSYKKWYHTTVLDTTVTDYNLKYLNKIMDLCEEHGVKVFMMTAPISNISNAIYANSDDYYNWYCQYAAEHGVEYYDFNLLKEKTTMLPDATMYYDWTHLNTAGADIFTEYLCDFIKKVDAGQDLHDLFYKSYVELDQAEKYSERGRE